MSELDCQRCGACCVNPPGNRLEGYDAYVEVERGDGLWKQRALFARFAVLREDGGAHLRLGQDGRCRALRGKLGRKVRCELYHHRPSPCRRVQAGSELCLRYREQHGIMNDEGTDP